MSVILLLMLGGELLTIPKVSGNARIAGAFYVFNEIDPDFGSPLEMGYGMASKETRVYPYELTQKATFAEMFGSLLVDLNSLCLTEDQIITFVVKYALLISKNLNQFPVLFLTKTREDFFVVRVCECRGGFCVERYPLAYYFHWPPSVFHYRVVVPYLRPPCSQLAPKAKII